MFTHLYDFFVLITPFTSIKLLKLQFIKPVGFFFNIGNVCDRIALNRLDFISTYYKTGIAITLVPFMFLHKRTPMLLLNLKRRLT